MARRSAWSSPVCSHCWDTAFPFGCVCAAEREWPRLPAFFLLVVGFWRYVSLGSIAAAAVIPLLVYLLWAPHFAPPPSVTITSLAIAALVIYQHRGNVARLARGEEPKFSLRKQDPV